MSNGFIGYALLSYILRESGEIDEILAGSWNEVTYYFLFSLFYEVLLEIIQEIHTSCALGCRIPL